MTTDQFPRFEPATKTTGKQPLFVDTNTLVAYLYERAAKHEEIRPAITAIGNNQLPYYPLVTNQYVLDEVVSLLLSRADTCVTHDALDRILETDSLRVLDVEPTLVDRAITQFREYRDQAISLTDHVIAVQATDYEIEHILTYDTGFRTLGFTTLPHE